MSGNGHLDARKIHGKLGHPIVDADAHWLESGLMFVNAVRFWVAVNPDFFKATAVEKQAARVLAGNGGRV